MTGLILLIIVQLSIAGIVVLVLKHFLDQELQKAAMEKFISLKISEKIEAINIYHASQLPIKTKEELQKLASSKFTDTRIVFEQNQIIKGGLVIIVGDQILDFSIANRLGNLWS